MTLLAMATVSFPAFAADAPPDETSAQPEPEKNIFHGDFVVVGVGAMSVPTYVGSDNRRIVPVAGAAGEVAGVGFTIRGPSLSLNLAPDQPDSRVALRFGPQIRYNFGRRRHVKDPVVEKLGKLGGTVDAGFGVGATIRSAISPHDRLSIGVGPRWDISGHGGGMSVSVGATYLLPVSRAQVIGMLASADFVSRKYAEHRFTVTPAGAAASGLPAYRAKGGLEDVTVGIGTARDFDGDFLDGGFSIGGGVMYSRLYGSAAESPITSIRGSRDQWYFGLGLGYTF